MKRWVLIGLPLLLLAGLIYWRIGTRSDDAAQGAGGGRGPGGMTPVVQLAAAQRRDIVRTFEAVGTVESLYNVRLAPKVTGRIEFLEAREGDAVTPGQVLARIDPTEVEAQVRQREADLAEAQSRLAQARINQNPTNVSVSTQLRQQRAAAASAQAEYNEARQRVQAQISSAQSAVTEAESRVQSAEAAISRTQAGVRSASASLENARARYQRVNSLFQKGFVAAQDVDDARTAMRVQESAVEGANEELRSARALRDAAVAQLRSAEREVSIVRSRGNAEIEASRARLTQARASVELARANTAQAPAYRQNLAALEAAVRSAEASLRNAQAQRAETVIRSPIGGVVTERLLDPGAVASPSQPLLVVQSLNPVWVSAPVPEEMIASVSPGKTAQITLDAAPNRTFAGRVVRVSPSADPGSRQFTARINIDNRDRLIRPGMYARIKMNIERRQNLVTVPLEALQRSPEGPYVNVVGADNKVQRRPVATGPQDNKGVAILNGLQPGERVVTLSASPLREGQEIRTGGGGRPGGQGRAGGERPGAPGGASPSEQRPQPAASGAR